MVVLAAWAIGGLALRIRALRPTFEHGERVVVQLAIGFPALSYVLLATATFGAFTRAAVGTLVSVVALAGLVVAFTKARRSRWRVSGWSLPRADVAYLVCGLAAAAFALVAALAPETEYDALWYHLWLPAKWLAAGRPVDIVEEYISLYPLTWELLYGAAMALGGPVAAKLLHFACLMLVAATTWLLTRRVFPAASPYLASALAVTAPIVLWEATSAYVDLAVAWYVTLAAYALLRHRDTSDPRWVTLAAVTIGTAVAIKHLALVALAILTIALLRSESRAGHAVVRTVGRFVVVAMLFPLPWYVRAYAASGNPVFPELYAVLGARPDARWSDDSERGLRKFKDHFGGGRTARDLIALPWDATVHGERFGGTVGPLFLVLVPAAFLPWPGRSRRHAVLLTAGCAAYAACWASPLSSYQLRFMIPAIPFLAALAAEGAAHVAVHASAIRGGHAAVAAATVAALLLNLPPAITWHERDRAGWSGWLTHVLRATPLPVVIGSESERAYLERTVPSYRAWTYINTALPGDSRVLTFSGGDQLYADRPRIGSESAAALAVTWTTPAGSERAALDAAASLGVTHVLFDKRLLEDGRVRALAIGSDRMRACCLTWLYEDDRYALAALHQPGRASRYAARTSDPRPIHR
jgi:hypothetical protein